MTRYTPDTLTELARRHYKVLTDASLTLDEREHVIRKMLMLWDADATAEVARLRSQSQALAAFNRQAKIDAARRHGPDDDAPGAFEE